MPNLADWIAYAGGALGAFAGLTALKLTRNALEPKYLAPPVPPQPARDGAAPRSSAEGLYGLLKPRAEAIKTVLEMLVGAAVVLTIAIRVVIDASHRQVPNEKEVFHIVASGLAVVAAIELAYTLFTPSADEVVNPLMLGLSSALLFQVSKLTEFGWSAGLAVLAFVAALAWLFAIRVKYKLDEPSRPKNNPTSDGAGLPPPE